MPQMAPISWLILFFVFTMAFILFNMLNYYCFNYNNNNTTNNSNNMENKKSISMSWKW